MKAQIDTVAYSSENSLPCRQQTFHDNNMVVCIITWVVLEFFILFNIKREFAEHTTEMRIVHATSMASIKATGRHLQTNPASDEQSGMRERVLTEVLKGSLSPSSETEEALRCH